MTRLSFKISFWGPFRVGTGEAGPGRVDATVDEQVPLPASSLKGLMRDTAVTLRGGAEDPLVEEVFGGARHPSPWGWTDAHLDEVRTRPRTRIRIDPGTRTVVAGALLVAQEVAPTTGTFDIRQIRPMDGGRRPLHVALLCASARLVAAVGADRRRGNGWADLVPVDPVLDKAMLALLAEPRNDAGGPS